MPSTFGQWLIVVLALTLGLAAWWVLRRRQATSGATTRESTMEGDPVGGAAVVATPAAPATVDAERPEATVDPAPATTAVLDEPAAEDGGPTPAGAVLGGHDAAPTEADATTPTADTAPAASAAESRTDDLTSDEIRVDEHETRPAEAVPASPLADSPNFAEVEPAHAEIPTPRSSTEDTAKTAEPDAVAVPTAGSEAADDFRRIQGIGPKIAAALQDAGIRTYRQLAELDEAALRDTVRAAGLRAAPSLATWPQQAKVLAGAPGEADRVLPTRVGTGEDA